MFFDVISRNRFLELCATFSPVATETVSLLDASNRVLATDVTSREYLPLRNRSCMDGFAVHAKDTFGAGETNPTYLDFTGEVLIETAPDFSIAPGQCVRIPTGGCLPDGADAVVMVEHTHDMGGDTIEIRKSCAPGEHVMRRGEDAEPDTAIFPAGTRLRVQDTGLLAALGITEVEVYRRPKVAILSTGNEVIPMAQTPEPGQVRDVNGVTLTALAQAAGANAIHLGIVQDETKALTDTLREALAEHDLVLLSGGSSVGMRDVSIDALDSLPNTTILCHGVSMSPGKPTILAQANGTPVMGLPGQITSAHVVMLVLGLPLLAAIEGETDILNRKPRPVIRAEMARNAPSRQGREDFIRVRLEERPDALPLAHPVFGKSGLLRTLVESQGLARIEAGKEGLYEGQQADIWLY